MASVDDCRPSWLVDLRVVRHLNSHSNYVMIDSTMDTVLLVVLKLHESDTVTELPHKTHKHKATLLDIKMT